MPTADLLKDSDIEISMEGVLKLLRDIDVSKSCGPDNIPGILLNTLANCIADSVTALFNYSLTTGSLPNIWKEAKVTAIFKKGSRHCPNNYRPISLTCILCKLVEHIISSHIKVGVHPVTSDDICRVVFYIWNP